MKQSSLNPARLRIVLSISLFVLAIIGIAVFTIGYQQLQSHVSNAQQIAAKADASNSSLQTLATTKEFLKENNLIVTKSSQLVAKSQAYQYQDQIINDINAYASKASVTVTGITFETAKTSSSASATVTDPASASTVPGGIKTTTASIAIGNPVKYTAVLAFISLIEQSLFQLQISNLSLSQPTAEGTMDPNSLKGSVNVDTLTIEAYIK